MRPTAAMGTFLRVWRSEWAGLSRAQLATAVSARLHTRQAITSKAIRRWEEGHPPSSTEELEALCQVMRRHALSQPECEQFRRAVYGACVDRQYPESFGDGDLAHQRDVDEVAERLRHGIDADLGSVDVVRLVASTCELEQAVLGRLRPATNGSQERRQEVALAYLQGALGWYHELIHGPERMRLAGLRYRPLIPYLRSHFGGWLGDKLNVDTVGVSIAHCDFSAGGTLDPVLRVLDMHGQAMAKGDEPWAATLLWVVVAQAAAGGGPRGLPDHLRGMTDWHLRTIEAMAYPNLTASAYVAQCRLATADRRWDEVDRYAEGFQFLKDGSPRQQAHWSYQTGDISFAKGQYAEALPYFERALEISRAVGAIGGETWSTNMIRVCEEASRSSRSPQRAPARR